MSDRARYLEIFKEEAEEHMRSLRDGLLVLEGNPEDADLVQRVLRNAHTLKGTSRMMGFNEIGDVAHRMEDVLKEAEKSPLFLSEEVVSTLLGGADYMQEVLAAITAQVDPPPVPAELLERLGGLLEKGEAPGKGIPDDLGKSLSALFLDEPGPLPQKPPSPPPRPVPKPVQKKRGGTSVMINLDKNLNTIRVDVPVLDRLTDLVGEMAISRAKLDNKIHLARGLSQEVEALGDVSKRAASENGRWKQATRDLAALVEDLVQRATEDLDEMAHLLSEIQEHTLGMRMLPLSLVFDDFYRLVRDHARKSTKSINLVIEGGETRLDKKVLEELVSPLIQMVTNAVDHGIEPPDLRLARGKPEEGTIRLIASAKGDHASIEVYDDGQGLDPAALRQTAASKGLLSWEEAASLDDAASLHLIFRSGFSTRSAVSGTSGRGVGMDVVKNKLEALKGNIRIESKLGGFTRFTLTVPLNYSVLQGLLVEVDEQIVILPVDFVEETLNLRRDRIVRQGAQNLMPYLDATIPLVELGSLLRYRSGNPLEMENLHVIVLHCRGEMMGLVVDRILRREEVIVKTVGDFLGGMKMVSGATILRLGDPAIILNVFDIFDAARGAPGELRPGVQEVRKHRLLVIDDSVTSRTVEKAILERAGYVVDLAADGEEGIGMVRKHEYDLVITDIEMPRKDGFQVTETLKGDPGTRGIPVVIVTSRAAESERRRGVQVGAQAYITKGTFDEDQFVATVRRLIG